MGMIRPTIVCTLFALLSGCGESAEYERLRTMWDGAVVVRICRSGTYIFRLKDGQFRTGGIASQPVENPENVCSAN